MESTKTSSPGRWKSSWQSSAKIAQAFYIAKKLNQALALPKKINLTWKGTEGRPDLTLKNIKTYRAIGIELLKIDRDRSRRTPFKISDYRLVCRFQKLKTLTFLTEDILKPLITNVLQPGKLSALGEWVDMLDALQRSEKILKLFSTEHGLVFTELIPEYRSPSDGVFEWEIKPPSNFKEPRHPWERLMAFRWIRKNHDLLTQAGIIE